MGGQMFELSSPYSKANRQRDLEAFRHVDAERENNLAATGAAVRKLAPASSLSVLGERQVRAICSTGSIDRAGEIVVQTEIATSAYRRNPIVLAWHDRSRPVGRTIELGLVGGNLQALIEFAPPGISAVADQVCGLVKSG